VLFAVLVVWFAILPAAADSPSTLADSMQAREESGPVAAEQAAAEEHQSKSAEELLAETWGIQVTSVRMSTHDHMIDYRYRVLDADKAAALHKRQTKPYLIHQESGKVLAVPETAKLGPLRNSNAPQEGKIYWMFFGNAGKLVEAGDEITVVIGDFRIEDLVVQ
jgi:hypothetical protein